MVEQPRVIPWDEAVNRLAEGGNRETAAKQLHQAIVDRLIGHYPPTAVPLQGRLDETGLLRRYPRDGKPQQLSVVLAEFEKFFELNSLQDKQETGNYIPGYLALIHRAIKEFAITVQNQPKAEELRNWFCKQTVNGEKVSNNLADAMTTICRLPERKKGGAVPKRAKG